jgi:hypothetical protein
MGGYLPSDLENPYGIMLFLLSPAVYQGCDSAAQNKNSWHSYQPEISRQYSFGLKVTSAHWTTPGG